MAWRICALVICAITAGVWSMLAGLSFCCYRTPFSPFLIPCSFFSLFFLYQKVLTVFPCENTCQTRMITVSFPSLYHTFPTSFFFFRHLVMDSVRDGANLTIVEELDYIYMSFPPVYPIYGVAENGKIRTWKNGW